jgi:hypothetical protein
MSKDETYYIEPSTVNESLFSFDNEEYIPANDSFLFAIKTQSKLNILQGEVNHYTENVFQILQENQEKEFFYIKAIKNLIKQKEYLNLLYQVSNELITEEEFSFELDQNEEKYLIDISEKLTTKKLKLLSNIIDNLNEKLSEDDVSELFSIRTNRIESLIINLNKENERSLR